MSTEPRNIKVTHPTTKQDFYYTEDEYAAMVKDCETWHRALENAIEVPEEPQPE